MVVQKNGVTYELTDRAQIDAFLGSGWMEAAPSIGARREKDPGAKAKPQAQEAQDQSE